VVGSEVCMSFELFIGLRYLKAKRKQTSISVMTLITVVGIMTGVMALIIVLSVMNGFREDLVTKILGVQPHILVRSYGGSFGGYEGLSEKINGIEGVQATTPYIYSEVLVRNTDYATSGALLRGIDTRSVEKVIDIGPMIKEGFLSSLDETHEGLPAIIVGTELARQLGVRPGNILTVTSPQGRLTPLGPIPANRDYRVTALFDSKMYQFDASLVFVSLKELQDFLGLEDRVLGIEVKVKDVNKSDAIGKVIQEELGYGYWAQDWKAANRSLFSAIELEKLVMFIILTLIVLVGALNIISTLVTGVVEKTRDVAILRAMGATSRGIMRIFMLQGLLLGIVGTVAGLVSGLGICHLLSKYIHIHMPTDYYGLSTLPVRVERLDVLLVVIAAVLISFLATLYPSWHASRLNPVEALRYE
jgi:lipoprotein-releasing system permease protein